MLESLGFTITGDESEQDEYLKSLLTNAQEEGYLYNIWWAHRDYDLLWETFPDEIKEIGSIWLNTGLVESDGRLKQAEATWKGVFTR